MADVSDPNIQEGSFPNNVRLNRDDSKPNSVFIAYLDVRSDKSDTNWLLLDYEACVHSLHVKLVRCGPLTLLFNNSGRPLR